MRPSMSHKEHKSIWEKISQWSNKGSALTSDNMLSLSQMRTQPGWRLFEDYARERRESCVRRMLNDPKAPIDELRARASEIDALLDWVEGKVNQR